jgi:hypothetical protein
MKEQEIVRSLTRRGFMSAAGSAMLSALTAGSPRELLAFQRPEAKADTMILLWMAGGMAQT